MIHRKGAKSSNPPSACYICTRMVDLGTTKQMMAHGVRCQYAGAGMRGHITQFPPELKKTMESPEFLQQFKYTRAVY